MKILGIETSCDETSAAVYGKNKLYSNIVASQEIHKEFGGVVPELASRAHIRLISSIVQKALDRADTALADIDGIAVTYGPGLVGSLLVGLNFAKALAYTNNIPWVGVNHIEAHIFANFIYDSDLIPPFIALIISGGHTQLVLFKDFFHYETIGKTRDDAAGEAYDKVAKMLELGYPGGPVIDKLAKDADPDFVKFPRPFLSESNFDFSFSGLKTAVLYYLRSLNSEEQQEHRADIVASFQAALVEVLIEKTIQAAKKFNVNKIVLAGGVACNSYLRNNLKNQTELEKFKLYIPSPILCTDNAAMIACTGFFKLKNGEKSSYKLSPSPSLTL